MVILGTVERTQEVTHGHLLAGTPTPGDTGGATRPPTGDCSDRATVRHQQRPGLRIRRPGEADDDSDLDLLIDVAPGHGYFDMAGFALDVEALLGVFTQVATENGLKARMRNRIIAEAIAV